MKTLKSTLIIALVLMGMSFKSIAQTQADHTCGLYLTLDDYLNHKLSYMVNANNSKENKIWFNEFLGQKNVTVISNGKKLKLSKSQLFGYYGRDGHDYRFYNNVAYQVVDSKGFYLYSFDKLVQEGKGPKPTRTFFFSTKANSDLLLLTQQNIDKAFAANHKFRYLVQAEFKADNELEQYDNAINEYKIKELYAESSK